MPTTFTPGEVLTAAKLTAGLATSTSDAVAQASSSAASALTVKARAPTRTDDAAHGFSNNLQAWHGPDGVYSLLRTTANAAVWNEVPISDGILPGDVSLESGAAPYMAFGARRVVSAYGTGPAFDLRRTSDGAMQTIHFLPSGELDMSAAAKFANGGQLRIAQQYDQSGNGRHKTQPTAAWQPLLDPRNRIGRSLSVIYDTQINGNGPSAGLYTYDNPKALLIPGGLSLSSQNMSMMCAGRARSSMKPACFWVLNNTGGTPANAVSFGSQYAGVPSLGCHFEASNQSFPSYQIPTQSPFVAGVSMTPGGVDTYLNNVGISTPGNPLLTLGGNGGVTGGIGNAQWGYSEIADEIWWANYMTYTDITNVSAAMYRGLGIYPQVMDGVTRDGDSITEGSGATGNLNGPRQLEALLKLPVKLRNTGFSGDTLGGRAAYYPYLVATLFNAGARNNVLLIAAGTNDIAQGALLSDLQTRMLSYCGEARATGFKVIPATQLYRSDFTSAQRTVLVAFNGWLRSAWPSFADQMSDWQGDPDMGSTGYPSNSALCADGIHPTSLGYAYLDQIDAAAINAVLQ